MLWHTPPPSTTGPPPADAVHTQRKIITSMRYTFIWDEINEWGTRLRVIFLLIQYTNLVDVFRKTVVLFGNMFHKFAGCKILFFFFFFRGDCFHTFLVNHAIWNRQYWKWTGPKPLMIMAINGLCCPSLRVTAALLWSQALRWELMVR